MEKKITVSDEFWSDSFELWGTKWNKTKKNNQNSKKIRVWVNFKQELSNLQIY